MSSQSLPSPLSLCGRTVTHFARLRMAKEILESAIEFIPGLHLHLCLVLKYDDPL